MPLPDDLCAACEGCPICAVSDCCGDCTADGDELLCECAGHDCGPAPDDIEEHGDLRGLVDDECPQYILLDP